MTEQLTEAEILLSQALLATAIEGPAQSKAAALAYQRKAISPGGRPADDSSLARKPGKEDNWVERAGGLPKYVRMVAHALIRDHGFTTSRAIATAVNRMKRWAVSAKDPKVKAAAAAALVEWNAKRGAARASKRDTAYLELKRERRVRTPEGARRFGKPIGSVIGGFRFMNDTQMDAEFGSRKRRYTYADGEHATLHESGDIVLSSGELGQYEHDVYASMNDEQAEELVTALAGAINGASTWDPDDPAEEREIDSETGWIEEFETSNGTRVGFDAVGDIGIVFPTIEAEGDEGVAGRGADEHHLTNSEARNLTNAVHSLVYEHRNGGEAPDDELFEDPDAGYEMELDPASGHAYIVVQTEAQSRRFGVPIGQTVWAPVEPDSKSAWHIGVEARERFNFPKGSPAGAEKSLRRVRTPQGARKFGQPIGSVIRTDFEPVRSSPDQQRRELLKHGFKPARTQQVRLIDNGWFVVPRVRGRMEQIRARTSSATWLRVNESGAIADQGKNVWHWEARNRLTGRVDHGVMQSQEAAMEAAEFAARFIEDNQYDAKLIPDELHGLTRVSPDQFIWQTEPDANGVIYGIEPNESDPKWWYTIMRVAGTEDWMPVRNSKGQRLMADAQQAAANITVARRQIAKAEKQGGGRLDMARLASRRPRGTTWSDFSYGLRGRDWGTDRDAAIDASTPAGRRDIAEKDSRDLGLYVYDETPRSSGEYPIEYQEILNSVMWSYNTMYPGVLGIMQTHTIGRTDNAGQGTLAWNSTQYAPTNYPTTGDKRGMLKAEIRFVKSKWVRPTKLAPGKSFDPPAEHGRYGSEHGHFSARWSEILEANQHGWSDDQLSYVVTLHHEIGHTVHETVFVDQDMTRQFWELLHSLGLSGVLGPPGSGNPDFNNAAAKLLVSEYSGTNIKEFMSEVWAEYMLDPEPREVVGLVGDFMAKALTKWLGDRSDLPILSPREAKALLTRSVRAPGGDWIRMEVKLRYVRTPEGADHYGVPIGTPITADLIAARDRGVPQGPKPVLHQQPEPDMVSAAPYQRGMLPPDTKMPGSEYTAAQVDEALNDLDGEGWDPIRHMLTTTYEDPYWQETVDAIDSAMLPSERPVQGFQPVSDPAKVFGPSWSEETSMQGLVFENPVYAPVSQDWRGTSSGTGKGSVVMRIGAPAGSKMVGMDASTLLLDRGGQYEVVDDYGYVDGVRQLEVVKRSEDEHQRVPFSADMPAAPKKRAPAKKAPAKRAPAKKAAPAKRAPSKAQAERTERVEKIGAGLHQDWQASWRQQYMEKHKAGKPGFESPTPHREKKTKDADWIASHGTDKVDIYKTSWDDLPKDWQEENREAGKVVERILSERGGKVDLKDPKVRSEVGEIIHSAWLDRHGDEKWEGDDGPTVREGALGVPFDELDPDEQEKDLKQLEVAMAATQPKVTREQATQIMYGTNPDLSKMVVADLRKLAEQRGVKIPPKARKADIIAALQKAKPAAPVKKATPPAAPPKPVDPGTPKLEIPKGGWTDDSLAKVGIGRTARAIILDDSKTKAEKRQALYKRGYSTEELDQVLPWESGDEKGPDNIGPTIERAPVDDLTKRVIAAQQREFELETELRKLTRARQRTKGKITARETQLKADLARAKQEKLTLERDRIGTRTSPEKLKKIRAKYSGGHDYASVHGRPEATSPYATAEHAPLSEHKPGQWSSTSRDAERKLDFERSKPALIEGARKAGYSEAEIEAELARMERGVSGIFPGDPGERVYRNGPHQIIISGKAKVPEEDLAALQAHIDKLLTDYPPTKPMKVEILSQPEMRERWGKGGTPFGFTQVGEGGKLAPVSTVVLNDVTFTRSGGMGGTRATVTYEGGVDFKMPSARKVPHYIYTMTHEFGHTRDYRGEDGHHFAGHHDKLQDGHDHNHDDDILHQHGGHISGYGRTNPAESYAEAFAEWVNTDGKTDNPAVRAYAERFDW